MSQDTKNLVSGTVSNHDLVWQGDSVEPRKKQYFVLDCYLSLFFCFVVVVWHFHKKKTNIFRAPHLPEHAQWYMGKDNYQIL